jgi:hypothetical protein
MRRSLLIPALLLAAGPLAAQVLFTYNPGPTRGSKWMAQASDGQTEASAAVLMNAPKPVWARLCYTIGPSDSTITLYAQNSKGSEAQSTQVPWGGCADVFGNQIWVGNPHGQTVGGYYGIAPATPGE